MSSVPVEIPPTYLAMPRWWSATPEDRAWLAALPGLVDAWCERWSVTVDGPVAHGAHAVVVPVRAGSDAAALRLAPPSHGVGPLASALEFWQGHGVVGLFRSDVAGGVLLLERLGPETLAGEPLGVATAEIGQVVRRLSVPVPPDVGLPHTVDVVRARTPELREAWTRLGRPFPERHLAAAEAAADVILAGSRPAVAVNGDLHDDQVLRAADGGWRVVDPVLLVGDRERTLVDVLWRRVDHVRDTQIPSWFAALVDAAGLDPGLAPVWARWRVTDYWLWGLDHGLTEDPERCGRLAEALPR